MDADKKPLQKNKKKIILIVSIIILLSALTATFFLLNSKKQELSLHMVSGTEYISGEYGQVIVRLADINGNAFSGAVCRANVLYPDKSYFLIDYPMIESTTPGNYYGQFTTPTINGIYEETIFCVYTNDKNEQATYTVSSSFHVSPALNFVVEMSALQAERYRDIVERINQTRFELMNEINKTFNQDFANLLINKTDQIMIDISNSENKTMQNTDNKFNVLYSDMNQLGQSITDIFSSPS